MLSFVSHTLRSRQRQGSQPHDMTETKTIDYIDRLSHGNIPPLHYIILVCIITFSTQEGKFSRRKYEGHTEVVVCPSTSGRELLDW
jgi:hypothetical protein